MCTHAHASQIMYDGQRTTFDYVGPRAETQIISLVSKSLFLMSHLVDPCFPSANLFIYLSIYLPRQGLST